MATLLFVVDDVFRIKGRGTVIVGMLGADKRPRVGSMIEFRRDGEAILRSAISGIETFTHPPPPVDGSIPVAICLVPSTEDKKAEAGQEAWLLGEP